MMGNRALTLGLALVGWLLASHVFGNVSGNVLGNAARAAPLAGIVLPPAIGVTERLPFQHRTGFALDGLDPVSFFLPGGPAAGSARHETLHGGLAWRFASAANLAAFEAAPERFLPRLGGHDPVALAERARLVTARPQSFAVIEGRLYLFRDETSRARVLADPRLVTAAEAAWRAARGELVQPAALR